MHAAGVARQGQQYDMSKIAREGKGSQAAVARAATKSSRGQKGDGQW